ncbi:unnamed protein product [Bursaphelenchus okinawaensis]|uniref:Fork-head domain-containing protein n=1 Tax=Bursaphelenchus okinawaensis TaxID=465554 RepID=A0A811KI45_9BILA|nr:unnamed protein product [Bursaphelenchus okinawaensis]CAG9103307.1 unnamed protein product [Bursaphelenchus okinawaensis]
MDDKPVNLTWLTKTTTYPFALPYSEDKVTKVIKEKPTSRPPHSLAVLIYETFRHHRSQLTVSQIADSIARKYDYYRIRKQWTITGTIRNALSKDPRFKKLPKDGAMGRRANYWILDNPFIWQEIMNGTAPEIKNDADLRVELAKRYITEDMDPLSKYIDSNNNQYDESLTDWTNLEVCKLGEGVEQEIQEILKSSDFSPQHQQHPWAEDVKVEDWIL